MAPRRRFTEDFLRERRLRMVPIDQLQSGVQALRCYFERELPCGDVFPEAARYLGDEQLGRDDHGGRSQNIENGRT